MKKNFIGLLICILMLALICSCSGKGNSGQSDSADITEQEEEIVEEISLPLTSDMIMFGLDAPAEKVTFKYKDAEEPYITVEFDEQGMIKVPSDIKIKRDKLGRIIKYEKFVGHDSEDNFEYTFSYVKDSSKLAGYTSGSIGGYSETTFYYDSNGNLTGGKTDSCFEGEEETYEDTNKYTIRKRDSQGNWTERVAETESIENYEVENAMGEYSPRQHVENRTSTVIRSITYPEKKIIRKKKSSGKHGVDLGLSVNWAQYNVGAKAPEEIGYRIPFGNTSGTVKAASVGNNISGTPDDIAVVKLSDGWRMPTGKELRELVEKCKWRVDNVNGRKGFRITGPNGNSIFLPATGGNYQSEDMATLDYVAGAGNDAQVYGNYWCGTPTDEKIGLNHLHFSTDTGDLQFMWGEKYFLNAVRPVHE